MRCQICSKEINVDNIPADVFKRYYQYGLNGLNELEQALFLQYICSEKCWNDYNGRR